MMSFIVWVILWASGLYCMPNFYSIPKGEQPTAIERIPPQ